MHIFVDRTRNPEIAQFDKIIRSFQECVETIKHNEVVFISINYEIDENKNALDLLKHLKKNNITIPFMNIHTSNTIAKNNIRAMIKKYFPETIITFIKKI